MTITYPVKHGIYGNTLALFDRIGHIVHCAHLRAALKETRAQVSDFQNDLVWHGNAPLLLVLDKKYTITMRCNDAKN